MVRTPSILLLSLLCALLAVRGNAQEGMPQIPASVRVPMVAGDYDTALAELDRLRAVRPEETDTWLLVRGVALRAAGRLPEALVALELLEGTHAGSVWLHKARFQKAEILRELRRFEEAERIYEEEAKRLLSAARKRELAEVYLGFADELSAEPDPGEPNAPAPEYGRAYELYRRSLDLGAPRDVRERALFRMGLCRQEQGDWNAAIRDFETYVREFDPSREESRAREEGPGKDVFEVRYRLGVCRRSVGDLAGARRIFEDLGRDVADAREGKGGWASFPLASDDAVRARARDFEGRALYAIARTWDWSSVTEAPLAAAALARFAKRFPDHALAYRAGFEIGEVWLRAGRHEDAFPAFASFLARGVPDSPDAERREEGARLRMLALYQEGAIRRAQGHNAEAIGIFREYVGRYPTGPSWAQAQQAIIDAEYDIGEAYRAEFAFDEARRAWNDFLSEHPLDSRAPTVLHDLGELFAEEADRLREKADDDAAVAKQVAELQRSAIAQWRKVVAKYPGSDHASQSLYRIGELYETELGELESAIAAFRDCSFGEWSGSAQARLTTMTVPHLLLRTERVFRTDEMPRVELQVRNIEKVQVELYRIDLEAYFRKHLTNRRIEDLDLDLIAPDEVLEVEVDDYADYAPLEQEIAIPMEGAGVYAVAVIADDRRATTLLVRSDIDVIVKSSHREVFVFAQDMRRQTPAAGVRVLVGLPGMESGGSAPELVEAVTDDDGVARVTAAELEGLDRSDGVSVLALREGHFAAEGLSLGGLGAAAGIADVGFVYTDRPAYRPGQLVSLRAILREAKDGRHTFRPGERYLVEVSDSQGRMIHRVEHALSEFGTLHDSLVLDDFAPVGEWTIVCRRPAGGTASSGHFTVDRYMLQPIELRCDVERDVYYRGERVEVNVRAGWHYGEPVVDSPVRFTMPDGRVAMERTDEEGHARFSFETRDFPSEGMLSFRADLLEEGVGRAGGVYLSLHGYAASVRTARDVVLAGDSFDAVVETSTPDGEPVARPLKLLVLRRESTPRGRFAEVLVAEHELVTDAESGVAHQALSLAEGGTYVLRAQGVDRFANPIVAEAYLFVSGDEDAVKLRLLTASTALDVGEPATLDVHNRAGAGLALITFEAEKVFDYRLVRLVEGRNELTFPVGHEHFPNFAVSCAMMRGHEFFTAEAEFTVQRELELTVIPEREVLGPGEEATLRLEVTDQRGQGVRAEVSLAVVDAALFDRYPDTLPAIVPHFQEGAWRTAALRTATSCTFGYEGATANIDADVLAENRYRALEKALEGRREELLAGLAVVDAPKEAMSPEPGQTQALEDSLQDVFAAKRVIERGRDKFNDMIGLGGGAGGRFGGRFGGPNSRRASGGAAETRSNRELMAETAFWAPDVVTDDEGRATLTFRLPDVSTRWRVVGRGVTADTVLGETEGSFLTRSEFFVELRHPGALTEGDRPQIVARVHNLTGARGEVRLKLRARLGDEKRVLPATVTLEGDGVSEHVFAGFGAVPLVGAIRLELEASATLDGEERTAAANLTLPVRPWGVEHAISRSGVLTSDRTLWLELPADRAYRARGLELYVGPGVGHVLVDEALGGLGAASSSPSTAPSATQAEAAAELFGVCAVLDYLRGAGLWRLPERPRLVARAHGLVARLVASQRDDGGWAWSGSRRNSDPATSAYALAALGRAHRMALVVPPTTFAKAIDFARAAFRDAEQEANELKAMLQWALSVNERGDFAALNRLHRLRQSLSPAALAYTALALEEMNRRPMADDLVARLVADDLVQPLAAEFGAARCRWSVADNMAWNRAPLEMAALALQAIQKARPRSTRVEEGVRYLLSARPWRPARARGFVLAALSEYRARSAAAGRRGAVTVEVGGEAVETIDFTDETAGRFLTVDGARLGEGRTRVDFRVRGDAEIVYSATLRGFSSEVGRRDGPGLRISDHSYLAPGPSHRGEEISTGFGVLRGPHRSWENTVEHLPLGAITHARVRFYRDYDGNAPSANDDYLVLDVPLPAGTSLLDGSVSGDFASFGEREGLLRFHVGRHRGHGSVFYSLVGASPGEYRVLPARLRSAYDPEREAVADGVRLAVLRRGEASTDTYRPTPSELYYHGKALYDAGERARAHGLLLALFDEWKDNLRPKVLKDTASMLLFLSIDRHDAAAVVRFFEVLKEKDPELTIPFEKVLAVGEAYRGLEEYERALLIFRTTIEETFGRDLKVAGALEEQGAFLGAIGTLKDLWTTFPDLPSVVATYLTVADKLLTKAPSAHDDATLREAGVDQAALELAGIVLLQRFLTLYPEEPLAPDAGLQLVSAFLSMEDFETASALAGRLAERHAEPRYADAFRYTKAVADWQIDRTKDALEVLGNIATAEYTDEAGVVTRSENRELALYILGQIHHALRQPRKAIEYYEQVASVFPDAQEAIDTFREKRIGVEEVTTIRPGEELKLHLTHRNVKEAELLVYSVDLMTLYLREKNLSHITAVNLAGIAPTLRKTVSLGEGEDMRSRETDVELSLTDPGAYLVICRGDDLHASGLVLVSPLELDVREDPETGHMRVQVIDRETGAFVKGVEVKVIGSENQRFLSGKTDPRGIFLVDAVAGTATVIARLGSDRYAFYRGTRALGTLKQQQDARPRTGAGLEAQQLDQQSYFKNVMEMNRGNQVLRLENLKAEIDRARKGVQVKQVQ